MAKKPAHKPAETKDGEGSVDGAGATPASAAAPESAAPEPAPAPVVKRPLTSTNPIPLAELNAAAQREHVAKRDLQRLAADAAAAAIARVVARTG